MTAPLPAKDGVGPSHLSLLEGAWETVLEFLVHRFPGIDRVVWIDRMTRGDVVDDQGSRVTPDAPYRAGIRLYYYRESEDELRIPFEETLLYRDDHLLVVDKPHFLPVVPAGRFLQETLLVRLKKKLKLDDLVPIHRIDRETAGLVLFSIRPQSRDAYHSLFHRREVVKVYEAVAKRAAEENFPVVRRSRLVEGDPFFLMKETDGEPNSETRIEIIEPRGDDYALFRLTPLTGRKHQLRVHMASLGIPIVNDAFYPTLLAREQNDFSRPLQLLARSLVFTDPLTGVVREFESRRSL